MASPEQENIIMNSIAAALAFKTFEGTVYLQPEFLEAIRSQERTAFSVSFRALYAAGPAMGDLTLFCWVYDEVDPMFGPNVRRVSDLSEDPTLEKFDAASGRTRVLL